MFVANARRPFAFLDGMYLQDYAPSIYRGMVCLVVVVGAYGQIHDSLMPPASPWSDLHVGFGALLLCTIGMRIRTGIRQSAENPVVDLCVATRGLARLVYLLLYALAGLRELANVSVYLWRGGTFDLGWIMVGNSGIGAPPMLPNIDSFQVYVSYGIVAIFVIRMEETRGVPVSV